MNLLYSRLSRAASCSVSQVGVIDFAPWLPNKNEIAALLVRLCPLMRKPLPYGVPRASHALPCAIVLKGSDTLLYVLLIVFSHTQRKKLQSDKDTF